MKWFVIFFFSILFVSCSNNETSSRLDQYYREKAVFPAKLIEKVIPINKLEGTYFSENFNSFSSFDLTRTKPENKINHNLFSIEYDTNYRIKHTNLTENIDCAVGLTIYYSIKINSFIADTLSVEFKGAKIGFNEFHVLNKYLIDTSSTDTIKFTYLSFVSIEEKDSINLRDNSGLKQGKWIQKMKNGAILRENNYLDGKKDGEQIEYYSNGKIRMKENYKFGKREGYQFDYYEDFEQTGMVSYYKNDSTIWAGFPRANENFIRPVKDFHIKTDSIYVIAPYRNGKIWYEGTFLNPKRKSTTGKRVGIHKIYHTNGQLKATLNFDTKRITEYDSLGTILRDNDTFEEMPLFPTNYKKKFND